jgi:hypothetical protein
MVLIASQLALKYNSSIVASMIAVLPIIALVTYSSSKEPQKTALDLAIFMIISGLTFLIMHFLPDRKLSWAAGFLWASMTYLAFKIIG